MTKQMVGLSGDMIATTAPARQPEPDATQKAAPGGGAGEPLNFRVTPEFRRQFRQYALDHNKKLSEVLVTAFQSLIAGDWKDYSS